ncbi:hypothetical protein K9M79_02945 [Candidatus Woesearchaeota archaeon]|nr:hypothetical protein [Candidatus Woesearchaeota archaeon]
MDSKKAKRNRINGADFERRVRADLVERGWTVIKNPNNLIDGEFKQGKAKFNPFTKRIMMMGGGFPDFIAIKRHDISSTGPELGWFYDVIGVECKIAKYLKPEEKETCQWILDNNIFSKILIAYKTKEKNRVKINYLDFEDYGNNK